MQETQARLRWFWIWCFDSSKAKYGSGPALVSKNRKKRCFNRGFETLSAPASLGRRGDLYLLCRCSQQLRSLIARISWSAALLRRFSAHETHERYEVVGYRSLKFSRLFAPAAP